MHSARSLHEAAFAGDFGTVKILLNQGVNPNMELPHKLRPLHKAAMNGNLDCMMILVGSGAEVDVVDAAGRTPLHYAASNGYLKAVRWLVEDAEAGAGMETKKGHTARLLAKKHGHSKVAVYLAEIENKLSGHPWPGGVLSS